MKNRQVKILIADITFVISTASLMILGYIGRNDIYHIDKIIYLILLFIITISGFISKNNKKARI